MIANWARLNDTTYDFTIDPDFNITSDSAYAVYWEPMTLGAGQSRTYVTYYGLAQLDIDLRPPLALGVSAPATLDALTSSYSPNPFEIVATVFNNGTATATDVQLTLNLTGTTGLTLTGGLLTQSIGDVAIGQERQVTWRVFANPQSSQTSISYAVVVEALNIDPKTVVRDISLPGVVLPAEVKFLDTSGTPVSALDLNTDGWPVLASGTSTIANPVEMQVTLRNPESTSLNAKGSFTIGKEDGTARFVILEEPSLATSEDCDPPILHSDNNQSASYIHYSRECVIELLPNQVYTLTWKLWIQPSVASTLSAQATLHDAVTFDPIGQHQVNLQVPQAQIRPVVVVPGILASFRKGNEFVLDPFQGTYIGLIEQLKFLGYEDDLTIIRFPYQWYGKIKDTSDPNDVNNLVGELKSKIDNWWSDKTTPAYVKSDQFNIVAHSTGGIITRQYVRLHGSNNLHTVFLVATPNQGAPGVYASWEGVDTHIKDFAQHSFVRRLFDSLAMKSGCFDIKVHSGGFESRHVSDQQLYQYLHGQNCITEMEIPTPSGMDYITTDNGPQPGIPLLAQLLPPSNTQAVRPYLFDNAMNPLSGPSNPFLEGLNAAALVDAFIYQLTTNGRHLFSLYSDDYCTVYEYKVAAESTSAPLWMNGTAKPIPHINPACDSGTDYWNWLGDADVPVWSADLTTMPLISQASRVVNIPLSSLPSSPRVGHTDYFNTKEPLEDIVTRLVDASALVDIPINQPPGIDPIDWTQAFFSNECPVTMLITDSLGRRIGTTPDGQDVNEIPGGFYTGHDLEDGPDFIWFPNPATGVYTVTITGLEADYFQVQGQVISETMTTRLGFFSGQIQPGQVFTYTTTPYQPTTPRPVLLVNDNAGTTTMSKYSNTLAQLGRTTNTWDVALYGLPKLNDLYPYNTVIWATGNSQTFTETHAFVAQAYLDYGGTMLLSGQDLDSGFISERVFTETLRAQIINPTVDSRSLEGDDLLDGLTLQLNGGDSADNQVSPSALQVFTGAISLAQYTSGTGNGQAAGLRYATRNGRLVYLSFGIEGLQTALERETVVDRLLNWLETGADPSIPSHSTQPTVTFTAEADARVEADNPTSNYGTSSSLDVDTDDAAESYMRFTVSGISGPIQDAKVRVYATSSTVDGPAIYATGNNWSETSITWNTRLSSIGNALDNKAAITSQGWVEYNVTSVITGNGTFSFVLVADSEDGVEFSSRQGGMLPELVLTLTPQGMPNPRMFNADADARVRESNPQTNYGTSDTLEVDGDTNARLESYLRFTVHDIVGVVQSAKLRVYATEATVNGPALYAANTGWIETGINWNIRPALVGGMIDNKGAISANTWVEYDVTAIVNGDGTYDFALIPESTDGVKFSSRQGDQRPQLVLTITP